MTSSVPDEPDVAGWLVLEFDQQLYGPFSSHSDAWRCSDRLTDSQPGKRHDSAVIPLLRAPDGEAS